MMRSIGEVKDGRARAAILAARDAAKASYEEITEARNELSTRWKQQASTCPNTWRTAGARSPSGSGPPWGSGSTRPVAWSSPRPPAWPHSWTGRGAWTPNSSLHKG